MKAASAALIAALQSATAFLAADLYTFTLLSGTVLRFSGLDGAVTVGADTYAAGALRFRRSRLQQTKGLQVSSIEIDIYADQTVFTGTSAFLPFAAAGGLDGGTVTVERLMLPLHYDLGQANDTAPAALDFGALSDAPYDFDAMSPLTGANALKPVTLFSGRVSDCEMGRTTAKLSVKSWPELLNVMMPRNLYQAPCVHSLFDTGCALIKANYAVAGAVAAGSTQSTVMATLAQASGYFSLGEMVFTSGANAGLTRTIRIHTAGAPGAISLVYPLPVAPTAGDTFTIYPGCDKQQATCSSKFGNLANFRGFPFVPNMETSI